MKNLKNIQVNKKTNDPNKVDPTREDERDNDATRIRPEKKEEQEKPDPSPDTKSTGKNRNDDYQRTLHKPEPTEESGKQQGSEINKGYNQASPDRKDKSVERDDQGNPVL